MKHQLHILSLSAGKIEDNGVLYANLIVLDDNQAYQVDPDRIDVGQKHAKVKMSVDNNNQLAKSLAVAGLIPGLVNVDLSTTVKKGEMAMVVTSFESLPSAKRA